MVTANGYVRNAVKLPSKGDNFTSYSKVAELAGLTYVHSQVKNIIVDAYQALQKSHPDKRYKYAETGLVNGGKFSPHKTHQNGLSVDFMTPVVDEKGNQFICRLMYLIVLATTLNFMNKASLNSLRLITPL
ncbi:hypothetical protein [uncultured Pseudoalteromonas sp.]|uniref:hypothetical protein n=1 Tax=uncultured Pseudoalteromonas sp. TaxID=114053 RepID=UPI0032B26D80